MMETYVSVCADNIYFPCCKILVYIIIEITITIATHPLHVIIEL